MLNKQKQAIEFMREKKFEEAAKLFIEIIDENPEDPIGYINFGNVLELMHQHDKAERFYLKAIELDE
ncbi:MAG TPA: tetratricopeptide repeat protein, partial [Arachidicoccus soli]|nr:tetratricopeptide repeat protein [Arachidicoccus soli]